MKKETFEKLLSMKVVKKNNFDTPHGQYQISILSDTNGDLYFVKWKNDILVEMVNLSDRRKQHVTNRNGERLRGSAIKNSNLPL